MKKMMTLEKIFERTTAKPNGCIEWTGGKTNDGYGVVWHNGRNYGVHRLVSILQGIEIPKDYKVCHKCDNPPCVNPEHLFIGTHADNMHDAQEKGRMPKKGLRIYIPKPRKQTRTAKHGSRAMYNLHKCRCELCVAGNKEYIQSYRRRKRTSKV